MCAPLVLSACASVFVACTQLWFSNVLRDAFAAQAAGLFRDFKTVGAYHLEVLLRQAGKDARCGSSSQDANLAGALAASDSGIRCDAVDVLFWSPHGINARMQQGLIA